jgi:hypothetical protein
MNRHCCITNTHALDYKKLNAHAQIRKTDLDSGLDKPGQEKTYEMCESRAEVKQDDIGVFKNILGVTIARNVLPHGSKVPPKDQRQHAQFC